MPFIIFSYCESRVEKARFWGAHAPRVLAMTPRHRELGSEAMPRGKVRFGEAPKPAREGACAPQNCGHVATHSSDTGN